MPRLCSALCAALPRRLLCLTTTAALLGGCAAKQRIYTLPPKMASQADMAADPLVACATVRNYQAERNGNVVKVYFDEKTATEFDLTRQVGQTMAILIDDAAMSPVQANKVFDATKQRSEELFACATRSANEVAESEEGNANDAAQGSQQNSRDAMMLASSMGDVAPNGDSCAILASCYSDIAATVCNATDAQCRANYTVSQEMASDNSKCQQTLSDMPNMASSLKKQRPNFEVPSSCSMPQMQSAPSSESGAMRMQAEVGSLTGEAAKSPFQGNWQAQVVYSWACEAGKKHPASTGKQTSKWAMTIAGDGDSLTAQVAKAPKGFAMSGQAEEGSLRLCGALPFKAQAGMTANAKDTNVCFVLDRGEKADSYSGHAEGVFQTANGSCTLNDATVQLMRQ